MIEAPSKHSLFYWVFFLNIRKIILILYEKLYFIHYFDKKLQILII